MVLRDDGPTAVSGDPYLRIRAPRTGLGHWTRTDGPDGRVTWRAEIYAKKSGAVGEDDAPAGIAPGVARRSG